MQNFFIPNRNIVDKLVIIDGSQLRHIKNVVRKRKGDLIKIFDEGGYLYLVEIMSVSKEKIEGKIVKRLRGSAEPRLTVNLYQCIPKSNKMDLIVQKCTEIGVFSIHPIISTRTIVKLKPSTKGQKIKRWQKIAQGASEQSRRTIVPRIFEPQVFSEAVGEIKSRYDKDGFFGLIPWEEECQNTLKDFLKENLIPKIANLELDLFIGPEGGFTRTEVDLANRSGIRPISIGNRIMRTETAGLISTALILYEYGDLE